MQNAPQFCEDADCISTSDREVRDDRLACAEPDAAALLSLYSHAIFAKQAESKEYQHEVKANH